MKEFINKNKLEIRFAGAGGQGLQAAATVLGEAYILSTDKFVCQSQNYGPESRGGLSYSDLIVSDTEIDFPKIKIPAILVCMSQESIIRFSPELIGGLVSVLFIDLQLVSPKAVLKENTHLSVYAVSSSLISEEITGTRIVSNMVVLGAMHGVLGIGQPDMINNVIKDKWPEYIEENSEAFRRGVEFGKECKKL